MALDVIDYDYTVHARANAGDENLLVKFFMAPTEDSVASKEEGRPIFKDVEWVDIRIPGSRDNIVVRPVRPKDLQRFPQHYAAFKIRIEKGGDAIVGTLLENWPIITAGQAKEMHFFNIRTVENLAGAPDSIGTRFMNFHDLKAKAKAFLRAASETAPLIAMQEKIDQLETNNSNMVLELKRLKAERPDDDDDEDDEEVTPVRRKRKKG